MRMRHTIVDDPTDRPAAPDLVAVELERTGASATDIRTAADFIASAAGPRAYDALSGRMRRLVDLLMAAPVLDRSAA